MSTSDTRSPGADNTGAGRNVVPFGKANASRNSHSIGSAQGALLLDDVQTFVGRFVAYPSAEAHVAHTLWIAHTHLMACWDSTPRIAFLSAEPASGKSRALEVSSLLVPNAVEAVNVSPNYLFRKVATGDATILFDEVDTIFGPRAKDNEDIRGFLNAGHRRGATAGRCVIRGNEVQTEEIPAFAAVALAGLGNLPDTIMTRSVVVSMRRRLASEYVEPFRRREQAPAGEVLRQRLSDWAGEIASTVADSWPAMPPGVQDRDADVWESLLSVADAAGGDWPKKARVAAVTLVTQSRQRAPGLGVQLLADLRTVFRDEARMATTSILVALQNLPESPWLDLRGSPLNDRRLAKLLDQYGVKPKVLRVGSGTVRGYSREDLADAWARYLAPASENT